MALIEILKKYSFVRAPDTEASGHFFIKPVCLVESESVFIHLLFL